MKRNLTKEYRIRKFKKLYENFDDDLDAMSDEILKNDPYVDIDDEVDKKAKDIIDKEPGYFYKTDPFGDRVKTYDTIEEWLDDKTADIQLNPARPHHGDVVKDLNLAIKQLTHIVDGLKYVRRLKNYIKEISNMNVLVAQQKLVSALRKRIKEEGPKQAELLNKHKEQFNRFIEDLKSYIESEIKRCVSGGKSYYITSTISPKNDFSVDFVVRDKYYKDRTISFNVTEHRHIAWNIKHLYDVKMKRAWPSEKQNINNKELTEKETKNYISGKVCWKLNGYEFDEGRFYPYDPNF
jgi:hypothetical protein